MSEMTDLYQEMILDHYKNPRNFGKLAEATHDAEGHNPLCGDHVHIYLKVSDQGVIEDISFEGAGCAISKASASLMTAHLKGKTLVQAQALFERVHALLTGQAGPSDEQEELGKLQALAGVCAFPVRVKCATLAWHTMRNALAGHGDVVHTE